MQKVSFNIANIATDLMTAINGQALPQPINAIDYIYNNANIGEFWIENDVRGYAVLCTNLPLFTDMELSMTDSSGNNPYTASASEFVGGRPTRPVAK